MKDFIRQHREDDTRDLMLHASRYPDIDMRKAVVQISGWQKAQKKLPLWAATEGILFPEHLSLEQCSSEQTATYKALMAKRLIGSNRHINATDLTGGFGIDCTMLAMNLENLHLTYVEQNAELCLLAQHNFPLLGICNFDICNDTAENILPTLPRQDIIYIDPARRDLHGHKTVAIGDCTPDVAALNDLLLQTADYTIVKLSPMLDIAETTRRLKGVTEIHAVSIAGECKELLVVLHASDDTLHSFVIHAVNDGISFDFTPADEQAALCPFTTTLGTYLYEPNASLLKASAFKLIAQRFNLSKLHPSSHLYTSDMLQGDFPGRIFRITTATTFNRSSLKTFLKDIKKANLSVRNFPLTVAQLRSRLKISEGGSDYIFATTLANETHVLIRSQKV